MNAGPSVRRFAVIALPFFAVERMLRDATPDDRRAATALVLMVRNRREVVALSGSANERGIRIGMTATEACAIYPRLRVLDADPDADALELQRLSRWLQQFSPRCGTYEDPSLRVAAPPCLWIDTTGCDRLFGGEWSLTARIATAMRDEGYSCRVVLADSVLGARAVAVAGERGATEVVPESGLAQRLAELPVWALPFTQGMLDHLGDLALDRISALEAIDRPTLISRFAPAFVHLLDEAHGRRTERLSAEPLAEPLCIELPFPGPTDRQEALLFLLRRMVKALAEQLAGLSHGVTRVQLTLGRATDDEPPVLIDMHLAVPQRDEDTLFTLLSERVERVDLGTPIDGMLLLAHETEPLPDEQGALFAIDQRRPQQIGALVDQLRERLGPDGVLRLHVEASHVPEDAGDARRVSDREIAARGRRSTDDGFPADVLQPRPSTLLSPPVSVEMRTLNEQERFTHERTTCTIEWRSGPERVVTSWWGTDDLQIRDYFVVHTAEGPVFWMFRDANTQDWFVHGVFD